ncbi:MAG TPA: ABC transporter ATP-binding protein [Anaerolineae bacterium]|nr:ABC transporter ATP-binding protein [Anaerolineae bacterium]
MYPLYADPRDRLRQSLWYALPKFLRGRPREFYKEFWALREVSFEIKKGETVGIIGRNGSGKSTLLQIIAGTLAPSWGQVEVNGRVAALLELGSGFNPEFTGRENVYLNGSILGLSQAEIDEIYDDVLAFADIGQFVDQPVKLYSSGMVVRLAFAVQVMTPKEILIVDEALAVGDEAFQRKCMRAMEEFQDSGGSILLVSHDAQLINRRCQEALLLVEGRMLVKDRSKLVTDIYQRMLYANSDQYRALVERIASGVSAADVIQDQNTNSLAPTPEVVQKLVNVNHAHPNSASYDPNLQRPIEKSYGNGRAEILEVSLLDQGEKPVNVVISGNRYHWCYKVHFHQDAHYVHFGMMLKTIDGVAVYAVSTLHEQEEIALIKRGSTVDVIFTLDMNLAPATYFFNCGVSAIEVDSFVYLHRRIDVMAIRVVPCDNRNFEGISFMNHRINYKVNSPIDERV